MAMHVPEGARVKHHPRLGTDARAGNNGYFDLDSCEPGWQLAIIASDGEGWEHVSVHAYRGPLPTRLRTPTWREMCFVKNLFWDDEDEVFQFHPPRAEYVNMHPNTLHLWRPLDSVIARPPKWMV